MSWSRNILRFVKLVPSFLVMSQVSVPTARGVSVMPGHESKGHCNKLCCEFGKWEVALQWGRCCVCHYHPWICIWNCCCIQPDEGRRKLLCHNIFPILLLQSQKKNLKEHHTVAVWKHCGVAVGSYDTIVSIWGFSWPEGGQQGCHSQVEFGTLGLLDF